MNLNKVVFKIVSVSLTILVLLLIVIGLVRLGTFCYEFGYRVFTEAPMEEKPGTDVTVIITSGMSEREIGDTLKEKGLIRDSLLFMAQLKTSAYSGKLKAGTYELNTSMKAKEMMAVMAAEPAGETDAKKESGTDQGSESAGENETESDTQTETGDES